MQKLLLDRLTPSMELAYDVVNAAGAVLASTGQKTDEALLRRFELAGIAKVMVRDNLVPGADMGL